MSLKKLIPALAVAAASAAFVVPAHAGYVVLDGWTLKTPVATTTNIGRLNVVSGTATVIQEVNGGGTPFVGAKFVEDGVVFSLSYTKENVTGAGDSGPPTLLGDPLTITFDNVAGVVTNFTPTGGFLYQFTSGDYTISSTASAINYASGSIIGIGGTASSTNIIGGINGDSTLLANILSSVPGFDVIAGVSQYGLTAGQSLLASLATNEVLFETVTNNNTTNVLGARACPFATTNGCIALSVASAGDIYVVAQVPEPGALALVGVALAGLGAFSRRSVKKA